MRLTFKSVDFETCCNVGGPPLSAEGLNRKRQEEEGILPADHLQPCTPTAALPWVSSLLACQSPYHVHQFLKINLSLSLYIYILLVLFHWRTTNMLSILIISVFSPPTVTTPVAFDPHHCSKTALDKVSNDLHRANLEGLFLALIILTLLITQSNPKTHHNHPQCFPCLAWTPHTPDFPSPTLAAPLLVASPCPSQSKSPGT